LPAAKKSTLVDYIRKEYKLPLKTDLRLIQDKPINASCYRELIFQGRSPAKTWEATMYLSPDGRFLTSELFDTATDPLEEERLKAKSLMTGLAENKGTAKGPENAPVTIVEFSDFQCPFCRKLADLMKEVLPAKKDTVRVVFHHMPLSIHSWARPAALGAACAQLQSSGAFWSLHDQLFQHQQEITASNVKDKLMEYAQNSKGLDMHSFQTCIDSEMSLGLVFRDMNLATAHNIQGTPTLFVNGRRIPGVRDADQLRRLITEAEAEGLGAGLAKAAFTNSQVEARH
jgi:protein-disulfide isomerase